MPFAGLWKEENGLLTRSRVAVAVAGRVSKLVSSTTPTVVAATAATTSLDVVVPVTTSAVSVSVTLSDRTLLLSFIILRTTSLCTPLVYAEQIFAGYCAMAVRP